MAKRIAVLLLLPAFIGLSLSPHFDLWASAGIAPFTISLALWTK